MRLFGGVPPTPSADVKAIHTLFRYADYFEPECFNERLHTTRAPLRPGVGYKLKAASAF
jgi:hypothetical protein